MVHYPWVPPNHPKLDRFRIDTHGFGDAPILRTPPYIYIYSTVCIIWTQLCNSTTGSKVPGFQTAGNREPFFGLGKKTAHTQ